MFARKSENFPKKKCEKEILIEDITNSLNLRDIFNNIELNGLGGWITFKPLDGKHDKKYINHIYKLHKKKRVFDTVHSHNFSKGFHKYGSRTLKFAPIHNEIKANKSIEYWIAIFGSESFKVSARIRIFDNKDKTYEKINLIKIDPNKVTFINLNQLLNKNNSENIKSICSNEGFRQFRICQIESEKSNLSCKLYIIKKIDNDVQSVAVDHFTGG